MEIQKIDKEYFIKFSDEEGYNLYNNIKFYRQPPGEMLVHLKNELEVLIEDAKPKYRCIVKLIGLKI